MKQKDLPFLREVYASTRREEVAPLPWPDAEKEAFLTQQFEAQHAHYMEHYPDAFWLIIKEGQSAIGRLYLEQWPSEWRIIDIALLPEARGKGYGTALLKDIMELAFKDRRAVGIHVETTNPAMSLYKRLGFRKLEDKGVYYLMRWTAEQADSI